MRALVLIAPALLPALVLASCSPSVDAAAKADVDRRGATFSASGKRFEAPTAPTPMPLAAGQWVTYKMVDKKGEPSLTTLNVVGQDAVNFWYESKAVALSAR